MSFTRHSDLVGRHAFLSPSSPHWVNYDEDKLARVWNERMTAARGTALHEFAHQAIRLGVKLPDTRNTLNTYVNDGIGYRMTCEQAFKYSENCFGHADTASFRNNMLRIHDLKNGVHEANMLQLRIYFALFCLEYGMSPFKVECELRIYQMDSIRVEVPEPDEIYHIMDRIKSHDRQIRAMKGV